jgi:hypothetical protein
MTHTLVLRFDGSMGAAERKKRSLVKLGGCKHACWRSKTRKRPVYHRVSVARFPNGKGRAFENPVLKLVLNSLFDGLQSVGILEAA